MTAGNPVRVIEVLADRLDLASLGFEASCRKQPAVLHPATLLKTYLCDDLSRVQPSWRLERERQRTIEVTWLTGRLAPDFKIIVDFRRDNGPAIQAVCRRFVLLRRKRDLFSEVVVATDGSRLEAVKPTCSRSPEAPMTAGISGCGKAGRRVTIPVGPIARADIEQILPMGSTRVLNSVEGRP